MVEVTIIGFLMGTLIAFLVVIGDLGPQIVAELINIENNDPLRTVVMTGEEEAHFNFNFDNMIHQIKLNQVPFHFRLGPIRCAPTWFTS